MNDHDEQYDRLAGSSRDGQVLDIGDVELLEVAALSTPDWSRSADVLFAAASLNADSSDLHNLALQLEHDEQFAAAAVAWWQAARALDADLARGDALLDDDALWADAARLNAVRCAVRAAWPLAAAAICQQIKGDPYASEGRSLLASIRSK